MLSKIYELAIPDHISFAAGITYSCLTADKLSVLLIGKKDIKRNLLQKWPFCVEGAPRSLSVSFLWS